MLKKGTGRGGKVIQENLRKYKENGKTNVWKKKRSKERKEDGMNEQGKRTQKERKEVEIKEGCKKKK